MITVTVTPVLMTIFLIVFSLATGVFSTFLLFWAHGGGWHPLRMARDIVDDLRAVQADPVMIGYAPTLAVVFVLIVVWCVVLATFSTTTPTSKPAAGFHPVHDIIDFFRGAL